MLRFRSNGMHVSALRYDPLIRAGLCASLFLWLSPFVAAQDPQAEFRRGVVALHHFEYEDANETFRRIQGANPGFAMAYWGEAMTYHQTLWRNENIAAARAALNRLGSTPAARSGPRRHAEGQGTHRGRRCAVRRR